MALVIREISSKIFDEMARYAERLFDRRREGIYIWDEDEEGFGYVPSAEEILEERDPELLPSDQGRYLESQDN